MLECLVNGEISNLVASSSRGLNYGDGLFETLRVVNARPLSWQAHMQRLGEGCERLGINAPPQALLLREVQTVSAGKPQVVVKIVLARAGPARGYAPGQGGACDRIVSSHVFPAGVATAQRDGVRAKICDLRLALQPALGGIKHLNRLEQVLASAECRRDGFEEGILLDHEDHVICAVSANIFLVMEERLLTPRLDRCGVRGVIRSQILSVYGTRCEQRRLHADMLADADEVFICNSVRGIVPVTRIESLAYPIGPLTQKLQAWLQRSAAP